MGRALPRTDHVRAQPGPAAERTRGLPFRGFQGEVVVYQVNCWGGC